MDPYYAIYVAAIISEYTFKIWTIYNKGKAKQVCC
jgi:hypothetical protein